MSLPTSIDAGAPASIGISRVGTQARNLFVAGSRGHVAAVFKNSFYLEDGTGMACIGTPSLGLGPLNALCDGPDPIDWHASGIRVGAAYRAATDRLTVAGRIEFALCGASTWQPGSYVVAEDLTAIRSAVAALERESLRTMPDDGLAPIVLGQVRPDTRADLLRCAGKPIAGVSGWLADGFRVDEVPEGGLESFQSLVGLGPGLTPSGDDLIGGILIALAAIDRPQLGEFIWSRLQPIFESCTNAISRAHLGAAAKGQGNEAVHAVLRDVLKGEFPSLPAHLDTIDRIGHTSGWDALAGVIIVLRAYTGSIDTERRQNR